MPSTRSALFALAFVALASPASAAFHRMSLRQVFAGASPAYDAQFVMLQMWSPGQNFVSGHTVDVFDDAGALIETFTFPSDVASGANQDTILIATAAAEAHFGLTADLIMNPVIPRTGGMVCFETIDCVSWGSFAGRPPYPSPPGSPAGFPCGIPLDSALERDISAGDPTLLEGTDDTDDGATDFSLATALPQANDGSVGAPPPAPGPALLRNDEVSSLAPITPPLDTILFGSLFALGPNGIAEPFECGLEEANGTGDDDDTYLGPGDTSTTDPDPSVLTDTNRPLVFYQVDDLFRTLRLLKLPSGGIAFAF